MKSLSQHYSYLGPEMLAVWQETNEGCQQPEQQIPDDLVNQMIKASRAIFWTSLST